MDYIKFIDEMQLDGRAARNVPMKELTTMRVGGAADCVVYAKNMEDIRSVVIGCKKYGVPLTVIGRGSNLIVRDGGLRGVVLHLGKDFGVITVEGNTITAQAGATLGALSRIAQEHGLAGLEFAEGIPGSVGGGVYMNAGAYGGEMAQVLVRVRVLTQDGDIVTMEKDELDMRYRHTKLMELGCILLEAEFALAKGEKDEIAARMADFSQRRREKQPIQYPSAGSFFKRPEGYFAGKLIQDAGLKGATVGGAQISELHAGFMINIGGATASDVLTLMNKVQAEVIAQFGVQLEPEVRIIGEDEQRMNANEYQKEALRTLNPELSKNDVLINGVMGLCGEAGECIDIVKKHLAQGHALDREKLIKELGDVAWYLAETAYALDADLETVLKGNLEKLRARYPEGFDAEKSVSRTEEE